MLTQHCRAIAGVLAIGLGACSDPGTAGGAPAATRDAVAVCSGPAWHLATLAGPDLNVELVAPLGTTSADWRPSDDELTALVTAKRVLLVGADFEPWTQRAGLPPSRVARIADGLAADTLITVGSIEHTHGTGPAHSHGGPVPTIWTDPDAWGPLLDATRTALGIETKGNPGLPEAIEGALSEYRAALDELAKALDGRALIASDHGLEYIARAANIEILVALLEPDESGPTNDRGIEQLDTFARRDGTAGVLVWIDGPEDSPFPKEFAALIQETLRVTSVAFDTGAAPRKPTDTLTRLTLSVRNLTSTIQ